MRKTEFKTLDEVFELMKDHFSQKENMVKIHILNEANMKLENELGVLGAKYYELKTLLKECKEELTSSASPKAKELLKKINNIKYL